MKIDNLDQHSLNILRTEQGYASGQARELSSTVKSTVQQGDQVAPPSIDFSQLGEAHTLDPERVAALIASPFGDE